MTNALVSRLGTDYNGRIDSIEYVDRTTGQRHRLATDRVVLCASACESARILLNSRSERFPDGLANSSGQVGRNLMDSTGANVTARVPGLRDRPRYNEDGHTGCHLFVPWWGHDAQARGELDFARGYHFEISGGFGAPGMSVGGFATGWGNQLKQAVSSGYGSYLRLALRGEMLPSADCFMDIDPHTRDRWGIPVPRFHWRWSDQELHQVAHGLHIGAQIFKAMGAELLEAERTPQQAILKGGEIIHEVGTTRMGASPSDSVTDQYGQTWDHPNLYIMDGGVFASNPHKNCTLTLMTLAMRNANRLAEQIQRGVA